MLAKAGEGELRTVRTKLRGSQDRSVGIRRMHSFGICRGIFCGSELHGIRSGSRIQACDSRRSDLAHADRRSHVRDAHRRGSAPPEGATGNRTGSDNALVCSCMWPTLAKQSLSAAHDTPPCYIHGVAPVVPRCFPAAQPRRMIPPCAAPTCYPDVCVWGGTVFLNMKT